VASLNKSINQGVQMKYQTLRRCAVASAVAAAALLSACATQSNSASAYPAYQVQREQVVRLGTVESVREVTIERRETGVGATAGAVVGGVAGSSVGGRRDGAAGAVLGAVVGGVIGQAMENSANKRPGLEITIRMDNGDLRAFVQEADGQQFRAGDRVRILQSGQASRVIRD
jgi:outer membrane lipoprotein SlyB